VGQHGNQGVIDSKKLEHDNNWNTDWGQFSSIRDNYIELELDIECNQVPGKLLARVYDEGVAG